MTSFTWASTASGSWVSPVFWTVNGVATSASPGSASGNADSATLAAAGTATLGAPAYPDLVDLNLSNPGAVLQVDGGLAVEGDVANAGTILLGPNARMTAGNLGEPSFGAFLNTGLIDVGAGASFALFAPTTTAALGRFAMDTGTIVLAGQIDNAGTEIAASGYGTLDIAGTVVGGILRDDSAALRIVDQVPQGDGYPAAVTFNGVTFQGVLAPLGPLTLTGGFTLEPLTAGQRTTIDLTGTASVAGLPPLHAAITVLDSETLDAVTILLGALESASTLTLGAQASVSNAGTGFLGGSGVFLSSASIVNTGFLAINNANSFVNAGVLTNLGGTITDDNGGTLVNAGTILMQGGHLVAPVTGGGVLQLAGGATAELTGRYAGQDFQFLDDASLLRLDQPGGGSQVLGFQPGDTIELVGTQAGIAFSGGTLSIANGNLAIADFSMPDQPANAQFHATIDAEADTIITSGTGDVGNTLITETVACFAAGTRIATPLGDSPVEDLRVGDIVRLAGGGNAAVIWLGHRRIACGRHPRPWDIQPIRILADAFGPGQPARDLRLSPDHAVFWDGALVPVRALVNGRTIVQEQVAAVTYCHVELARHAVILADGLACESYLDTGNRAAFDGGPARLLHADFARRIWAAQACAPLVLEGDGLARLRRHLLIRAMRLGHWITDHPDLGVLSGRRRLQPRIAGRLWRVPCPAATARPTIRLRSRVWTPAHTRIAERDHRRLGVAIANLQLDGRPIPLDDPRLQGGWHAPEPEWRWTDGDAAIRLPEGGELAFEVRLTGSYWQQPDSTHIAASAGGMRHVG